MLRFQAFRRTLAGLTRLSWNTERRETLTRGISFLGHRASQTLLPAKYSTSVKAGKRILGVKTLRPDRLISSGQSVLNLAGHRAHHFVFANDGCLQLTYFRRRAKGMPGHGSYRYPPDTKGVFYYDSAKSELRFRLCKEIGKFEHGHDLVLPNGSVWYRPLVKMARDPRKYAAPLALITAEFEVAPADIDSTHDCHRVVSTFFPQRLGSLNQQIFNISGLTEPRIYPGGISNTPALITFATQPHPNTHHIPFPPNTIGVFYYHQSETAPTRLGELRFRLCSEVRAFDEGSDLCLPSGAIWFRSTSSLHFGGKIKPIREYLIHEGLLERDLYPGVPASTRSLELPPLTSLGQPFVVELSCKAFQLELVTLQPDIPSFRINIHCAFRTWSLPVIPVFSGRAIVRLEEYPTSLLPTAGSKPLFAMRILEMLTPFKRLSVNDNILDPVPGELLMRKSRIGRRQVTPWGYGPTKPDVRKAVENWIAQPSSQH